MGITVFIIPVELGAMEEPKTRFGIMFVLENICREKAIINQKSELSHGKKIKQAHNDRRTRTHTF